MHVVFLRRSKQGLTAQNYARPHCPELLTTEPAEEAGTRRPFRPTFPGTAGETEAQGEDETFPGSLIKQGPGLALLTHS